MKESSVSVSVARGVWTWPDGGRCVVCGSVVHVSYHDERAWCTNGSCVHATGAKVEEQNQPAWIFTDGDRLSQRWRFLVHELALENDGDYVWSAITTTKVDPGSVMDALDRTMPMGTHATVRDVLRFAFGRELDAYESERLMVAVRGFNWTGIVRELVERERKAKGGT